MLRFKFNDRFFRLLLLLIVFLTCGRALLARQLEYGDGREYVLQTQSIVFDRRLSISPEKRAEYWNATNPFGVKLRTDERRSNKGVWNGKERPYTSFGGLYPDRFGEFRFCHFWLYSFFTAPLYAALSSYGPGGIEYSAHRLLNVLLFCAAFLMLFERSSEKRSLIFALGFLCSPLPAYLPWDHAEIFCFSLTLLSFVLIDSKRFAPYSPLLLGLAAAQNIPLALFFPLHFIFMRRIHRNAWTPTKIAILYGIAALPIAGNLFYWKYYFGVWNLISVIGGASLRFISLSRLCDVFFSPLIGAVWYFPLIFLVLPVRAARSPSAVAVALLSVIAVAAISSATSNLQSSQVGSLRYSVWFLAPLYWVIMRPEWNGEGRVHRALESAALAASLLVILYFKTYKIPAGDEDYFLFGTFHRQEIARLYSATRYPDNPEILAEHIMNSELRSPVQFSRVYIWNLTRGSSLWLIPRRAVQRMTRLAFRADVLPDVTAMPAQKDAVFTHKEGEVLLAPHNITKFSRDPVLGDYMLLWVGSPILHAESNGELAIRSEPYTFQLNDKTS